MRMVIQLLPAFAMLIALNFGLVACGTAPGGQAAAEGKHNGPTGFASEQVAQQVEVAADPGGQLKWTQSVYEARAGDVTFVVKNKSKSRHNFVVRGNGVRVTSPTFGAGTHAFTLRSLQPGEYQIVCTVAGHEAAGMVAKLVVR